MHCFFFFKLTKTYTSLFRALSLKSPSIHSVQFFTSSKKYVLVYGARLWSQLEKDGLRGILATLYVFNPGASKPGDNPALSKV